jgi:hypothetical protein
MGRPDRVGLRIEVFEQLSDEGMCGIGGRVTLDVWADGCVGKRELLLNSNNKRQDENLMKLRTNLPPETDDIFMITNTDSI